MLEKSFKFSAKDFIKLSIMMLLGTTLFGVPGLTVMLLFQLITYREFAIDPIEKHGISKVRASRLGGVAVLGVTLILYIMGSQIGLTVSNSLPSSQIIAFLTVFACMCLGLMDDLRNNRLSPRIRLLLTFSIFAACLIYYPSLIPHNFSFTALNFLMSVPLIGWLITVIFCAGFINAVNMADGANGLIPGTLTLAFIIFFLETGLLVYAVLMTSCSLFAIFNIISGRLFLGDAGTYGLGSALVLSGLYLFSEGYFSAPFLAVLFAYPCIDLVFTVMRRKSQGKFIMLPDNDHLHNRIHFHCQRWFRSKTLSNSMTGILIVSCSSGLALLGFIKQWWPVTSYQWIWIFIAQCGAYLLTFFITGLNRPSSHCVTSQ